MPTKMPILVVDFDGVIHSYTSGWTRVDDIRDPPVPGALAFLRAALDYFNVAIFSSRSSSKSGIDAMKSWLLRWATENDAYGGWVHELSFPTTKPSAFVTLDDRAITFTGTFPSIETLLNFKTWNKP